VPDFTFSLSEALEKAFNAYNLGNYSETERLCTTILARREDFVEALNLLAAAQSELGRNDEALDNCDAL
jgi:hypothetical protein